MSRQRVLREMFKANKTKPDPGSGKTITIMHYGQVCSVTTAAGEARTLAQPTSAGLLCGVALDVDGGDLTLTVTGAFDQAGNTTLTFDDAGDSAFFISIEEGTSFYWRLIASDGVTGQQAEFASLSVDNLILAQGAPSAKTSAAAFTIAELLTKVITGTHAVGADVDYTLPTGTLMSGGTAMSIGDSFDWVLLNESAAAADTVTVIAGTNHTIVGNPIVQSRHSSTGGVYGSAGTFRSRMTAATTWITYRIG